MVFALSSSTLSDNITERGHELTAPRGIIKPGRQFNNDINLGLRCRGNVPARRPVSRGSVIRRDDGGDERRRKGQRANDERRRWRPLIALAPRDAGRIDLWATSASNGCPEEKNTRFPRSKRATFCVWLTSGMSSPG